MAFRASNIVPQEAYNTVKRTAVQLKLNLQSFNVSLASADADFDLIKGIYLTLSRANAQFTNLKSTPGIALYAQQQEDDPAYDVAIEFATMQAAIQSAMGWIVANIPASASLKTPTLWVGNDSIISTIFTPTQTAPLRTELSSVITTIG